MLGNFLHLVHPGNHITKAPYFERFKFEEEFEGHGWVKFKGLGQGPWLQRCNRV